MRRKTENRLGEDKKIKKKNKKKAGGQHREHVHARTCTYIPYLYESLSVQGQARVSEPLGGAAVGAPDSLRERDLRAADRDGGRVRDEGSEGRARAWED